MKGKQYFLWPLRKMVLFHNKKLTIISYIDVIRTISGTVSLVTHLIGKGADVNTKDDLKQTPLHWSAGNGKFLNALTVKSANYFSFN